MAKLKNVKYQAVIVIHGMGEQKPMSIIREFVRAVIGEKYYSRLDPISESLELRVLQAPRQKATKVPPPQFFEYYWAYKVKGSTLGNVLAWAKSLMFRCPSNETTLPKHLRGLWWLVWIITALILAVIVTAIILIYKYPVISAVLGAIGITSVLGVIGSLFISTVKANIVDSLGDAARYFDPSPKNIEMRRDIKLDGIKLLQKIHESGQYERVIVVGHSLGSVIGYDILKHYWDECREKYNNLSEDSGKKLKEIMDVTKSLGDEVKAHPENPEKLAEFRKSQHELWRQMRAAGNPWLVTDFITVGSPLTHASVVQARDSNELIERQNQKELPVCPPILDELTQKYSYRNYDSEKDDGKNHTFHVLHNAALFACTRWTNLYFPVKKIIFGDPATGPMRKWFGQGIKDVKVEILSGNKFMLAHSCYWNKDEKRFNSLAKLREALDLGLERTKIH